MEGNNNLPKSWPAQHVHIKKNHQDKYPKGIITLSKDNCIYSWGSDSYDNEVDNALKLGFKIQTVRNLSHELLGIDEETNYGKIYCFKIFKDQILVGADNGVIGIAYPPVAPNMNDVHPKKKAFVTDDGYEIEKDQNYSLVNKCSFNLTESFKFTTQYNSENMQNINWIFLKLSNAKKYIEENKPIFSKKQIYDAIFYATMSFNSNGLIEKDMLKQKLEL